MLLRARDESQDMFPIPTHNAVAQVKSAHLGDPGDSKRGVWLALRATHRYRMLYA